MQVSFRSVGQSEWVQSTWPQVIIYAKLFEDFENHFFGDRWSPLLTPVEPERATFWKSRKITGRELLPKSAPPVPKITFNPGFVKSTTFTNFYPQASFWLKTHRKAYFWAWNSHFSTKNHQFQGKFWKFWTFCVSHHTRPALNLMGVTSVVEISKTLQKIRKWNFWRPVEPNFEYQVHKAHVKICHIFDFSYWTIFWKMCSTGRQNADLTTDSHSLNNSANFMTHINFC